MYFFYDFDLRPEISSKTKDQNFISQTDLFEIKEPLYYLMREFFDRPSSSVFDKKTKGQHFRDTPLADVFSRLGDSGA